MVEFDCYECEGKGSYKINDRIPEEECYLCKGTGKLDWVENIVPQTFSLSNFQNSQIVRIVNYIRKTTEKIMEGFLFNPIDSKTIRYMEYAVQSNILEPLIENRLLCDYRVDPTACGINICIRPQRSLEFINIIVEVK